MQRRNFIASLAATAIAWPRAAGAQQKAIPVIGFLNGTSAGPGAAFTGAFHQGLSEIGYVEGQNVAMEYRWAEGSYDRLPALAADLVGRKGDVLAAWASTRSRMGWSPVSPDRAATSRASAC
jgi:putative tryptophan/tyrosine transport system substrate-binding protein